MFQSKMYEIFKEIPNAFGIADDILVIWYDSNVETHDKTMKSATNI